MRQSRFQEGVEKNIDFRDPFFSILDDFCCPGGSQKFPLTSPFLAPFRLLGAIFFDRGAFLAILMDFDVLGPIFG